jgi:hypothetical protein
MSNTETVESYLLRSGVQHDHLDETTWVIQLEDSRRSNIVARIEEPIILFSTPILEVSAETHDREGLFQTLLRLNSQLMHSAYALEGDSVVLSGAQELENLDHNELQAVLDDMAIALDNHQDRLTPWNPRANANDTENN